MLAAYFEIKYMAILFHLQIVLYPQKINTEVSMVRTVLGYFREGHVLENNENAFIFKQDLPP
jgi:hypothetical protein